MSTSWITTKQAAELMGVSQRTIQNWVDDGKLTCSRTAGGHRRLDPAEVSRFIESNYQAQQVHQAAIGKHLQSDSDVLKVLIVEDDFKLLRLCELRFAQFSIPHQLYLAPNVFQALIMMGKYQPHLIFTDLKLPHVNGLQMINEIIEFQGAGVTKIVIMTGMPIHEIKALGRIPEGVTVLPKPIPFNTIETILYQQAQALSLKIDPLEHSAARAGESD